MGQEARNMSRILVATRVAASAVLWIASLAYGQQDSQNRPLGDVAREQRELRKQREENYPPVVVHTDAEAAVASNATQASESAAEPASKSNLSSDPQQANPSESPRSRSVFDRPKEAVPDTIVVPAGAELRVDIHQHKVVVPVRVGFATPIPALSEVTVQVTRVYVSSAYSLNGMPFVDYVEYATITAVTVNGTTYQVQTDSVPLLRGGANSELTFVLGGPVAVLR
jgi:hypothetical protein